MQHRASRRVLGLLVAAGLLLAVRDAHAKKIALEAAPASCVTVPADVYPRVATLLTARGHTVTMVSATDIDTLVKMSNYDAVVFGGANFNCAWDWATFDPVLANYVNGGGGVVVTGWGAYYMANNTKSETYPGLETVLPVLKGTQYGTNLTLTVVAGHPITAGLADFAGSDYDNYGAGFQPTATVLLREGATDAAAAWTYGTGRAVYLGPDYLADWGNYANESLLDGSKADAQELFLRSVEWAAFGLGSPKIGVAPATLDLGKARVGAAASADVTVSNTGDKILTVSALDFTGTNAGEFTSLKVLPFDIAMGASVPVTVTWKPKATGARAATLTITSTDTKFAKPAIALSGTGVSPGLMIVSTLAFGTVSPGTTAKKQLALTNDGTDALSVASATLSGANAARFGVTPVTFPLVVAVGQTVNVELTYAPTTTSGDTATLTIASDDPMAPAAVVTLTGAGAGGAGGNDGGVVGTTDGGGGGGGSGSGADGGANDTPDGSGGNSGGCSCRTAPNVTPTWPLAASFVATALLLARRRKRAAGSRDGR